MWVIYFFFHIAVGKYWLCTQGILKDDSLKVPLIIHTFWELIEQFRVTDFRSLFHGHLYVFFCLSIKRDWSWPHWRLKFAHERNCLEGNSAGAISVRERKVWRRLQFWSVSGSFEEIHCLFMCWHLSSSPVSLGSLPCCTALYKQTQKKRVQSWLFW